VQLVIVALSFAKMCNDVLGIDANILVTGVVQDGRLVVSRFKPLVPQLNHERMAIVLTQAILLTSIPKTNEDVFGKVRFTMVHHDMLHTFMFPLPACEDKGGNFPPVFVMAARPPYHLELGSKVLGYLSEMVAQ
jgi:hypothetical protein